MNKFLIIISVAAAAAIGWLIISGTGQHQNMFSNNSATPKAPDFNLQDYNGNTVRSADLRGHYLVVNAWAAWCPFCVEELLDFVQAQKEFGDKVKIIAIDRAEPLEVAKKYTDELGISDELIFLLDPSDSFYAAIGGFSMPETIFVDKQGNIRIHKRGPMKIEEIRQKIQQLLG